MRRGPGRGRRSSFFKPLLRCITSSAAAYMRDGRLGSGRKEISSIC